MYDRIDDAGVYLVARVVHGMLRDAIAAIDAPPFFLWPDGPSPDSAPFFFLRDYGEGKRGSGGGQEEQHSSQAFLIFSIGFLDFVGVPYSAAPRAA